MDLIITILPVVTKDLPITPRFTPYDFLSRCKFSTLTTRQPMVEFLHRNTFQSTRRYKYTKGSLVLYFELEGELWTVTRRLIFFCFKTIMELYSRTVYPHGGTPPIDRVRSVLWAPAVSRRKLCHQSLRTLGREGRESVGQITRLFFSYKSDTRQDGWREDPIRRLTEWGIEHGLLRKQAVY